MRVSYPAYSREEVIAHLRAGAAELRQRLPLQKLVLFGSYASGRQTAASDIDVLVVYAGEPLPEAYALARKTLGLRGLEPHLYTESEAQALHATLKRMMREGVVIWEAGSAGT